MHRILTLTITWPNEEELRAIAAAVVEEMITNSAFYFAQLGTENTEITLLDQPTISTIGPSLRFRTEWPLRVLLALVVGLGLVFLLDYLDTSIRSSQDLEALGMPVLGTIPKR
jgi:capsular polysaccharide biosynthesis protein